MRESMSVFGVCLPIFDRLFLLSDAMQSAVMPRHVVRPSVRLSVCDVEVE